MNRLDPPSYLDDEAHLEALSQNKKLAIYPKLFEHVPAVKAGYQQYVAAKGDATRLSNVLLPDEIGRCLQKFYDSPPVALTHIKRVREESGANCCPMCGSFHSGTLDHVLPKADYPVFAIFGLNLVPACKCNSLRSTLLVGSNPGERILHPYFDEIMQQRLIVAQFDDLGPVPRIELRLLPDANEADLAAVRFHMENVVKRTAILHYVGTSWVKLLRRPSLAAASLRDTPASHQELRDILSDELDRQDDTHGSRNNWRSVFISGLLDDHVIDWLMTAFHRPGRRMDGPLVDVDGLV